ncbi:MAG: lysozyme [Gammaproteobacteria bacterium]|jgi:lysozyme
MDRTTLKNFIAEAQGRRLACYQNGEGIPCIGVGVNLLEERNAQRIDVLGRVIGNLRAGREELTEREVDWLLDGDIEQAIQDAQHLIANFDELDPVRQMVLVDMTFNLGRQRFAGFKRLRAAIIAGRFEEAANEMVDSLWFRQVKSRGLRNVAAMRSGKHEMTARQSIG